MTVASCLPIERGYPSIRVPLADHTNKERYTELAVRREPSSSQEFWLGTW